MNKEEILQKLLYSHKEFTRYINSLNEKDFNFRATGKWTAGEQADHILKAIKPLKTAFSLPKFVPRLLFGKSNRPSKTYDELVQKYQARLDAGGKSTKQFIPRAVGFSEREKLTGHITQTMQSICDLLVKYRERDLDVYLLPHPLLGKLTLREMLYFTIYHVQHHQNLAKKYLKPVQEAVTA
jgi:hypothetical protein